MLAPNQIPVRQTERVAMFEARFGLFTSAWNAYWSLRKGRRVDLAEGANFDALMRQGKEAPVWRGAVVTSRAANQAVPVATPTPSPFAGATRRISPPPPPPPPRPAPPPQPVAVPVSATIVSRAFGNGTPPPTATPPTQGPNALGAGTAGCTGVACLGADPVTVLAPDKPGFNMLIIVGVGAVIAFLLLR